MKSAVFPRDSAGSVLLLLMILGMMTGEVLPASATGRLHGVVKDTDGNPLAGVIISIVSESDKDTQYTALTLDTGEYSHMGVLPGKYKVSASMEGYIPFEYAFLEIEVSASEKPVEADFTLEKMRSNGALDPLADAKKGAVLLKEGRTDEAIVILEQALQANPDIGAVHFNLGVAYQKKEMIQEARKEFQEAIRVQPDLGEAYLALGSSYLAERESDGTAIEALKKASELMPESYAAFYNLGVSYANSGKYADAESAFRKATEIHPKEPIAHYQLGLALLGQSKNDAAIQSFQKYLELNPTAADRKEVEELIQTLK